MIGDKELYELRGHLEKELRDIEKKIHELETFYLEETAYTGNVVKGWGDYPLKSSQKNHSHLNSLSKKYKISAKTRIFSLSSTTSPANKNLDEELNQNAMDPISKKPSYLSKRKPVRNKNHYSLRHQKDRENSISYAEDNNESPRGKRKKNSQKKKSQTKKKHKKVNN